MKPVRANKNGGTRSVLVTGGAGFLGSNLCERLVAEGMRIYCLDNMLTGTAANVSSLTREPRFTLVEQDVCEPVPARLAVDWVMNLACAASPPRYQADPVHTMMTSVLGTRNLLDHASRHGARFLQASTSEIYGDPDEHPQAETYWGNVNPIGPRACYDEGKRAAETLCYDYRRTKDTDVRVARIFNTYGPRMRADDGRIVSNLICQALAGEPLTIYGDGEQTRSFCYVDDMIAGFLALMQAPQAPDGPVNLGNPHEFTILQLAEQVLDLVPTRSRLVFEPLPQDDPKRRRPSIARAEHLLGWRPRVPLAEGLPPTIRWFSSVEGRGGIVAGARQGVGGPGMGGESRGTPLSTSP